MTAPAPLDINLDELASPGPEWVKLSDRDADIYVNKKTGVLLLVDPAGLRPPSTWGILS